MYCIYINWYPVADVLVMNWHGKNYCTAIVKWSSCSDECAVQVMKARYDAGSTTGQFTFQGLIDHVLEVRALNSLSHLRY